MSLQVVIWLLIVTYFAADLMALPVQFPEGTSEDRSVNSYTPEDIEPKFHHGLIHKHKKKKKKRKKLGCLQSLNYHYKDAADSQQPDGRFFFNPLINYYNTDINVFNGLYGNKPISENGFNPCSSIVNGGGAIVSGIGSLLPGNRPKPPIVIPGGGITSPPGGGNGDDSDEDYDYSDGGDSSSSSSPGATNPINSGISSVGSVPGTVSNVISSINNGIKPVFERPERYFDYYILRPFNRSINQLFRWF